MGKKGVQPTDGGKIVPMLVDDDNVESSVVAREPVNENNRQHLQEFEDALTKVLAHPLFENVQEMAPAAIDADANKGEAGSQAGLAHQAVLAYGSWILLLTLDDLVSSTRQLVW